MLGFIVHKEDIDYYADGENAYEMRLYFNEEDKQRALAEQEENKVQATSTGKKQNDEITTNLTGKTQLIDDQGEGDEPTEPTEATEPEESKDTEAELTEAEKARQERKKQQQQKKKKNKNKKKRR